MSLGRGATAGQNYVRLAVHWQPPSTLQVTVQDGVISNKEKKPDPKVEISVGREKKSTKKQKNTNNPVWNETLTFSPKDDLRMIVRCMDDDFGKDDKLFEDTIDLRTLAPGRSEQIIPRGPSSGLPASAYGRQGYTPQRNYPYELRPRFDPNLLDDPSAWRYTYDTSMYNEYKQMFDNPQQYGGYPLPTNPRNRPSSPAPQNAGGEFGSYGAPNYGHSQRPAWYGETAPGPGDGMHGMPDYNRMGQRFPSPGWGGPGGHHGGNFGGPVHHFDGGRFPSPMGGGMMGGGMGGHGYGGGGYGGGYGGGGGGYGGGGGGYGGGGYY